MESTAYTKDNLQKMGSDWMQRIKTRDKAEEAWRSAAKNAETIYMADGSDDTGGRLYDFNILHSNVETIVPAIYNSTPAPDVRRRFADKDPAAKEFAEIVERAISIQIDDNRLDSEIEAVARDSFLSGRGLLRLRFQTEPERVTAEAVSWRDFRMGKAKRWSDVPWVAFKMAIDREELERITEGEIYETWAEGEKPLLNSEGDDGDDIIVWEIWCKNTKTVKFIRDSDGAVLKIEPDPLELSGFFPMPEPVQPITVTGKMCPACPFSVYQRLADELDLVTRRIRKIMAGLKVRGLAAGSGEADMKSLSNADDNEIVFSAELEQMAATKGLDGAITWWPVEKAIVVLRELYQQREVVKQSIYEITGISDIVRGASKSNETATAQQIKTQWGSLRIQKMQRLIQRQVRDVFVIMAELITTKFQFDTLEQMTGAKLNITPQHQQAMMAMQSNPQIAQQQPQIAQMAQEAEMAQKLASMFEEPILTNYRVDVESDSTVKADMTRVRGEAAEFLTATANYFGAMAPVVGAAPASGAAVAEIYAAFGRNFNLGRQAESALESLVETAQQASKQAAQQQDQPDPEQQKAQAEAQAMQAKTQAEQQKREAEMMRDSAKFQHERQMSEMDYLIKQIDLAIKKEDAAARGVQAEAQMMSAQADAIAAMSDDDAGEENERPN